MTGGALFILAGLVALGRDANWIVRAVIAVLCLVPMIPNFAIGGDRRAIPMISGLALLVTAVLSFTGDGAIAALWLILGGALATAMAAGSIQRHDAPEKK